MRDKKRNHGSIILYLLLLSLVVGNVFYAMPMRAAAKAQLEGPDCQMAESEQTVPAGTGELIPPTDVRWEKAGLLCYTSHHDIDVADCQVELNAIEI